MGLFDFFKKPIVLNDPIFGEIKSNGKGSFSCDCLFRPIHKKISCFIEADESGPTEEQRQFYKTIEDRYPELRAKIIPVMIDTFRNAYEDFEIKDFDSEFVLSSISLPQTGTKPFVWDICYYRNDKDDDHDFTITFNDLEPEEGVAING
jgi:hypothetical protein